MDHSKVHAKIEEIGELLKAEGVSDEGNNKIRDAFAAIMSEYTDELDAREAADEARNDNVARAERLFAAGAPLLAAYISRSREPRVDIPATVIVRLLAILEQIVLGRKLGPDEVLYEPAKTGEGTDAPEAPADPDKPSN